MLLVLDLLAEVKSVNLDHATKLQSQSCATLAASGRCCPVETAPAGCDQSVEILQTGVLFQLHEVNLAQMYHGH